VLVEDLLFCMSMLPKDCIAHIGLDVLNVDVTAALKFNNSHMPVSSWQDECIRACLNERLNDIVGYIRISTEYVKNATVVS
jgi:hypothetical protein